MLSPLEHEDITFLHSLLVPISRMEAYHHDRCEWMTKTGPLSDSMGLRSWDLPLGFEALKEGACGRYKDGDVRGLSNFGYALPVPPAAGLGNQSSGDFSVQAGSPGASYSSGTSYDCNSTGNVDSAEDVSLSSYLMDGNVRAMLKKVTVNEGALNQAIQSLGGGEKGLKELMGHIMIWVKEHNGENCDKFFSSQSLKKVHPPHQQVNPAFGCTSTMVNTSSTFNSTPGNGPYDQRNDRVNHTFDAVQSSDEPLDRNPFYQRAKSRRLMDDGEVDSCIRSDIHSGTHGTTFVDVRGSIPDEFRFPKPEVSTGSPNSIGQVMPSGMPRELDIQQPVPCLQSSLSFPSGQDDLSRTLAATTRAARRNRIARQRQSVQQSHPRTPSNGTAVSAGCGLWSVAPPALDLRSAGMYHPGTQPVPASSARKVCNMDMLTFLLQKELRPSDVGNLGRIILPKKEAELHLPILALREGVSLQMEDFDSGYCWNIRYRFWPNNKSRMYLLENTGEFVKSHYLEEGDLLILYRNQQGGYVLRGKKKVHSENRGAQELQKRNAHSLARGFPEAPSKFEEVLKERDFGMGFDDRSGLRVKAEPTDLVGDDDPFFKDDLMRNSHSSFGQGLLQPLERFPSLNLDFPLDEIIACIHKDDQDTANLGTKVAVVPKTEPAG